MPYLIQFVKLVFCLVSMVLTSLFALSLSGVSLMTSDGGEPMTGRVIVTVALYLVIGGCIDIGKYLFWANKHYHAYYGALGLVLMVFSWLASCAFLVSSEANLVKTEQKNSSEYIALQQRMDATRQEITAHERLMEKRLESAYHKQWEEGQENAKIIATLKNQLAEMTVSSAWVGKEAAISQVPSASLFNDVAEVLNASAAMVRGFAYGLLSLLLEISTLGMISLSVTLKGVDSESDSQAAARDELAYLGDEKQAPINDELRPVIAQLSLDILAGRVPPVLRQIRSAQYGLDIEVIRSVLKGLCDLGALEKGQRNSYRRIAPPEDGGSSA